MKKFRLFKLILLTLFVFKILLTSSFSENETPTISGYDLETESKLWETLDKNLKEQKQKEQEEQRLKQAQEEQRLKQAQEEQKQKERDKEIALLSKIFPENEASIIVKINNEIVTSYDLIVEIKYLEALNPGLKKLSLEQKFEFLILLFHFFCIKKLVEQLNKVNKKIVLRDLIVKREMR